MAISKETKHKMEMVLKIIGENRFYNLIGMKCVGWGDGEATLEMEFTKDIANIFGVAHGGAIASIADSACGIALSTRLPPGQTAVTVDLRINYLSPFNGGKIVARGEVVYMKNTTAIETARLTQDDKLVALANAVHFIKIPKS